MQQLMMCWLQQKKTGEGEYLKLVGNMASTSSFLCRLYKLSDRIHRKLNAPSADEQEKVGHMQPQQARTAQQSTSQDNASQLGKRRKTIHNMIRKANDTTTKGPKRDSIPATQRRDSRLWARVTCKDGYDAFVSRIVYLCDSNHTRT